jgi:hypothetical protein
LDYIRTHWNDLSNFVIFYNLQGKRIPAPFFITERKVRTFEYEEGSSMTTTTHLALKKCSPFVEARQKSHASAEDKRVRRGLPVLDVYAYRTGYIDPKDLSLAQENLPHDNSWDVHVIWCDQRVHYYYYLSLRVEVQLWPWIYLHNFHRDQASPSGGITNLRDQRRVQDELETE